MGTKTVKISEDNYREICGFAGELQKELGESVSIDRAITVMFHKSKLSDLAGSWKMNNEEAEDFRKKIKKGWSRWKIKSV